MQNLEFKIINLMVFYLRFSELSVNQNVSKQTIEICGLMLNF